MAVHLEEVQLGFGVRELEKFDEGQTILMALYVCVVAICCVTPIFYFVRLQMEYRHNQHLRRLEAAGIMAALHESQQNREESRAARRKYLEERKARIFQLFRSVRLTLKEENFVREGESISNDNKKDEGKCESTDTDVPVNSIEFHNGRDLETGKSTVVDIKDPCCEDGSSFIRVPFPGLYVEKTETRLVPGTCAICLCDYELGADVVWSSNLSCEHVFHAECIEAWLMKQREGPLCPCCRRDFVIDPYDCDGEECDNLEMDEARTFDLEDVELNIRQDT